ncbi:hypothetical protein BDN71DRAFT_1432673 [Pleurotus eryngii]|uniref:Ubiquitin-like protease family profile domain-containing protein n=1 Tax=Pleurotus eryngii TaxID=5323 RepID=A0A9P5ZTH6_PLEER|nr:hypothetical protein BDN71DRAFT_1432673 [Pleurotus eryngii]
MLGDLWISDEHINLMVELISHGIEQDEASNTKFVTLLDVSTTILVHGSKQKTESTKLQLQWCKNTVTSKNTQHMYLPVHINGNHWIAVFVDFKHRKYGYSDSLGRILTQPPSGFMKALDQWLKDAFSGRFAAEGNSLARGCQNDSFSCGIIAMNHCILVEERNISKRHEDLSLQDKNVLDTASDIGDITAEELPELETEYVHPAPYDHMVGQCPGALSSPLPSEVFSQACTISHLCLPSSTNQVSVGHFTNSSAGRYLPPISSSASFSEINAMDIDCDGIPEETADVLQFVSKVLNMKKGFSIWKTEAQIVKRYHSSSDNIGKGAPVIDMQKLNKWKMKLCDTDSKVEFMPELWKAKHSVCSSIIMMKEPYNATCWNSHLKKCAGKPRTKKQKAVKAAMETQSIKNWFAPQYTTSQTTLAKVVQPKSPVPCPGICDLDDSQVLIYLRRSSTKGRGARSVAVLSKIWFQKVFSKLKEESQQDIICDDQQREFQWCNDHYRGRVFSTSCEGQVEDQAPNCCLPCTSCRGLLKNQRFIDMLKKNVPKAEHMIFINKRFNSRILGKLYAKVKGLQEIIEAPNPKGTPCIRYALGVLQGKYKSDTFAGLLSAMVSKLDQEDCGVGMQNFQYAPAWDEMCHIIKINSPSAYQALSEHLPALSERYYRPVALSCDDTKLFACLWLYWDSKKKSHFLIVIAQAKLRKGMKARLTIPLPGAIPLIVAAIPIPNNLDVPTLYMYLMKILHGLIDSEIQVVSYACDGTKTKRKVQHMVVDKADDKVEYVIRNPLPGALSTTIMIAIIQHQHISLYQRILEASLESESPLYTRDVVRLDRQDDNAATCLFSSGFLRYLANNHQDHCLGEIIYLFVFGKLIDAYQNHQIPHIEQLYMALHASYFLDSWTKFVDRAGYKRTQYLISREAMDITRIIVEGLISLIFIVKDFSMLDFYYMIPKLHIKHRQAILQARTSDPKAQASGYCHTYFDNTNVDLLALAIFPEDDNINDAAHKASQEVDSLVALLGIERESLYQDMPNTILPSINAWYPGDDAGNNDGPRATPTDNEDSGSDASSEHTDSDMELEANELQALIEQEENSTVIRSQKQENALLSITCANFALIADNIVKVYIISDDEHELDDDLHTEEYQSIHHISNIIAELCTSQRSKPLGLGRLKVTEINVESLVELQHDVAAGTGVNCKVRTEGTATADILPTTSNAANAILAATVIQKKAANRRKDAFVKFLPKTSPLLSHLVNAQLEMPDPKYNAPGRSVSLGDYGLVVSSAGKLMVGRILTFYSKLGGKHSRHDAITETFNISALSNISVQTYKHMHQRQFCSIHATMRDWQTSSFALLRSINFLCRIAPPSNVQQVGFALSAEDAGLFKALQNHGGDFLKVLKWFNGQSKAETRDDNDSDM